MKLEVGKYYCARNGMVFGPLVRSTVTGDQPEYHMPHDRRQSWNGDGYALDSEYPQPFDLIEEVTVIPVAPKIATFYAAAWWSNDGSPNASIGKRPCDLNKNFKHGPIVAVELELPPKPEGMKP